MPLGPVFEVSFDNIQDAMGRGYLDTTQVDRTCASSIDAVPEVRHGPAGRELIRAKTLCEEAELQAKLRTVQQKVEDAEHRLRLGEEKYQRTEAQLGQIINNRCMGTDMEVQLMQNMVQLRQRVRDMEEAKAEEHKRLNDEW